MFKASCSPILGGVGLRPIICNGIVDYAVVRVDAPNMPDLGSEHPDISAYIAMASCMAALVKTAISTKKAGAKLVSEQIAEAIQSLTTAYRMRSDEHEDIRLTRHHGEHLAAYERLEQHMATAAVGLSIAMTFGASAPITVSETIQDACAALRDAGYACRDIRSDRLRRAA